MSLLAGSFLILTNYKLQKQLQYVVDSRDKLLLKNVIFNSTSFSIKTTSIDFKNRKFDFSYWKILKSRLMYFFLCLPLKQNDQTCPFAI